MLTLWMASAALGAPYGTMVPGITLAAADSEMGGAVSVGTGDLGTLQSGAGGMEDVALEGAPSAGLLFSAWARYGLTDRIEALGGAWLPISPLSVGIHGGARIRLLGAPAHPGPRVTIGASLGSLMLAPLETLALTVPVSAGIRAGGAELWITPTATVTQRGLLGVGGEVGVGVEPEGIPVLVSVQAMDWGEAGAVVSGSLGVAFRGGM